MPTGVSVKILWDNIPAFLEELPRAVRRASRESAEAIRQGAADRSRVRTGAMRRGWRVTEDADGITVDNPVAHTIFNEYGTRRMSAQPMLTPAVEEERAQFPSRVADAVRALADAESR